MSNTSPSVEPKNLMVIARNNDMYAQHLGPICQQLLNAGYTVRQQVFDAVTKEDDIVEWMHLHAEELDAQQVVTIDDTCRMAAHDKVPLPEKILLDSIFQTVFMRTHLADVDVTGTNEKNGRLFDEERPDIEMQYGKIYAKVFREIFGNEPDARIVIALDKVEDHTVYSGRPSKLVDTIKKAERDLWAATYQKNHEEAALIQEKIDSLKKEREELLSACEEKMVTMLTRALGEAGVSPDRVVRMRFCDADRHLTDEGYEALQQMQKENRWLILDRHLLTALPETGMRLLRMPIDSFLHGVVVDGHVLKSSADPAAIQTQVSRIIQNIIDPPVPEAHE